MRSLYLLALLAPEPVAADIWALKHEVHQLTGSRNALRLPPHITLLPPMTQDEAFEAGCVAALEAFAATRAPFQVAVEGFAWFGNRTLFVHVHEGAVHAFHAELTAWCAAHLPAVRPETRPFTPHLTLATRDLPPAQVPALRELFARRAYRARFTVQDFTLFRHNGQRWEPRATFALTALPETAP